MAAIQDKLNTELKEAMKAGDPERLSLLRGLSAALQNRQIEKRTAGSQDPLTDEEVLSVFQKEAKKRKEAAELFKTGNRQDLAEKEEKEMHMIQAYLPAQMSKEDLKKVVERLFDAGNTEFNTLIKATMAEVRGKADGQTVSAVIKEKLGQ